MKVKILLPLLVILFSSFACVEAQNKIEVNSQEVSIMLRKNKDLIVLDVRTPAEFSGGHIKGAINIDITEPDAYGKIDKLNPKAKYIVHCRTHHRSEMAVDYMIQKGFKNIYQMMDGYNGWAANNLPFVK